MVKAKKAAVPIAIGTIVNAKNISLYNSNLISPFKFEDIELGN
jgi:hypothetical protein